MKPGAGRPQKVTDRERRLIKLQQLRDDTCSLADLVRYADTDLNLSIGRSTVSCILRDYNMVSYIAPRKPRINPSQRGKRLQRCYKHLNWIRTAVYAQGFFVSLLTAAAILQAVKATSEPRDIHGHSLNSNGSW
ncbi:unnamed protein product [Rotaria magnacalcarata]|uniref:Transposase Tc1-like domain-containing protein n=3 Tax=Rotaria magnacalcarata TaxID=392030 RepID=A0A819J0P2_9BILA|nr:unnamed protein product [Rotaria magnacalcarata]CAF3922630.1 unnamed protein product [Rotaria magnacalcarata]